MSKLSTKNQITVPKDVLRKAGLRPGEHVRVRARGEGCIVVTRVDDLIARFTGALPGVYPKQALEGLRGEWRR